MNPYANRLYSVAEQLPDDVDGVLITSQVSRRYLTGLDIDNGYLILTRAGTCFITDSRYIEAAQRALEDVCSAVEYSAAADSGLGKTLTEQMEALSADSLLIDSEYVSVAQAKRLEKYVYPHELICDERLDTILSSMRASKQSGELELIRAAQMITERSFNHILELVREGVTEKELALNLEFDMRRSGADDIAFDLIVAAGPNGSMPHAVPGDYTIKKGDFITFDIGAKVGGYHSDMTRTVVLGSVTDEQRIVYETVKHAQKAGIEYLMNGGRNCAEADRAARGVIEQAGYGKYFGHTTGHGVGLEIHEAPSLSSRSKSDIADKAVVTVEPGIYLPGRFGVRIEDMIYCSDDGCIDLTGITRELIVL